MTDKILTPINKALETLKNLETEVKDSEKEANEDLIKCDPRRIFHFIS